MDPIPLVNAYWSGDSVVVVSRDTAGRRCQQRHPAEYSCFLSAANVPDDVMTKLRSWGRIKSILREGDWWRLLFRSWNDKRETTYKLYRPHPTQGGFECLFDRLEIKSYEADVNPVRRWLTDHAVTLQRPRRGYLDLETDSRVPFSRLEDARVLCWSVYDEDGNWEQGILDEDTDAAEKQLLEELWEVLDRFDQLLAWNLDRFDKPALMARSQKLGINVRADGWLWLDHMQLFGRFNYNAAESGEEKQSLALARVAPAILGEGVGKADLDANQSWEYWRAGGTRRMTLADYNLRDAELLLLIDRRTGFTELLQALCEMCTTLPDSRALDGTNFVEGYLLRLGAERGMRFPTHWRPAGGDPFEGAYVLEPTKKGILRDVHVADFSGMYPSIIQTWNLSPETYRPHVVLREDPRMRPLYLSNVPLREYPRPPDVCEAPDAGCFSREPEGILPTAIDNLKKQKKRLDDLKAELPPGTPEWIDANRRSTSTKVAINTFYGVVGSAFSRFYVREVAAAVTACGRWLIRKTIEAALARGWEVLYCDTDSIFVQGCTAAAFRDFVKWCNETYYPELLAGLGCPRNEIKIAYEKQFDRLVMLRKKRYAGSYAHYKGTAASAGSKPEVKGLEYKRGDAIRLARALQLETIERILGGDEDAAAYQEHVLAWQQRVVQGELELLDIAQSKSLSRDLADYRVRPKKDGTEGAAPTHVAVARRLRARGVDVSEGTRIEYVVTDGSRSPLTAIPAMDWKPGDEDRYYLWESLVWPPTERVLECAFPGVKWSAYGRVRPATQRRRKSDDAGEQAPPKRRKRSAAPEGQGSLFGG